MPLIKTEEKLEFLVDGKDINDLITGFNKVNPSYKLFYANKRYRGCIERVVIEIGYEKTLWVIMNLPKTNCMQYCPIIVTPLDLENKLGKLVACLRRVKENGNNKKFVKI